MIRERQFFLADLVILLVILGGAAAVAVPTFTHARLSANEEEAVAALHNVFEAQVTFRQQGFVDTDGDGQGEYAGLVEFSGAEKGRMRAPLSQPLLVNTLGSINYVGEATRIGYRFCIFLPDAEGNGVREPQHGFTSLIADTNASERNWCAYAWPLEYPLSGRKTFFINQDGVVLMTESRVYSGLGKGPAATAAFRSGQGLAGAVARGAVGTAGDYWEKVSE